MPSCLPDSRALSVSLLSPSPAVLPVTQPCTTLTLGRKGQKSCQVFLQDMLAIASRFLDLVKDGFPQ